MVGSGIRDPEKTYSGSRIPDPGGKKVPDPGSGSATLLLRTVLLCPWTKGSPAHPTVESKSWLVPTLASFQRKTGLVSVYCGLLKK
jgi:hypothetical protein